MLKLDNNIKEIILDSLLTLIFMKKNRNLIIFWSIIILISSQHQCAFFAILIIPLVFIYLIACVFSLVLKNKTLKEISLIFGIILFSYLFIAGIHYIRYQEARTHADDVISQLKDYKNKNGVYPKQNTKQDMSDILFNSENIYYNQNSDNEYPQVFYTSTHFPLDIYSYDFKNSQWEYIPD